MPESETQDSISEFVWTIDPETREGFRRPREGRGFDPLTAHQCFDERR